ncbi:MAG: ACT domain-containing protein [Anaerolineae bacterium]|nr:transcriptional regulator [Candidatus Roseilinea sp.]MDW8449330.1 ACT domain-containing protein [Anaerolineae bacterium]
MHTNIILTLTGPDRVGLVEDVTARILDCGGNVETSRMARLGGAFAVLLMASLPEAQLANLEAAFQPLVAQGYKLTLSQTTQARAERPRGWQPYRIEVHGADHEGIIHHLAHSLAEHGITIESMDTSTVRAGMSGAPLFSMTALVLTPPALARDDWEPALHQAGREMNVDVVVTPAANA